jgi:predicted nucleic acid-binding protein
MSALLAYFDAPEPGHSRVAAVLDASTHLLIVSPYVVAGLDYLVATRHGVDAELAVIDELAGGAWELAGCDASDLAPARSIIAQYRNQEIGVADAANVVLAQTIRHSRHRHPGPAALRRASTDRRRSLRCPARVRQLIRRRLQRRASDPASPPTWGITSWRARRSPGRPAGRWRCGRGCPSPGSSRRPRRWARCGVRWGGVAAASRP